MFNARLLLGGYAKVMIIKPNKRYEAEFRKFENEAKNAKRGLWNQ
ncbi:MAG: thermonuclease family protein [Synergistaceae bacterium]|nr:thermonuclease family protein [Synergistaceae bacterium]